MHVHECTCGVYTAKNGVHVGIEGTTIHKHILLYSQTTNVCSAAISALEKSSVRRQYNRAVRTTGTGEITVSVKTTLKELHKETKQILVPFH